MKNVDEWIKWLSMHAKEKTKYDLVYFLAGAISGYELAAHAEGYLAGLDAARLRLCHYDGCSRYDNEGACGFCWKIWALVDAADKEGA